MGKYVLGIWGQKVGLGLGSQRVNSRTCLKSFIIEVLHNFITSDHHPLSITFNGKFFTQIAVDEPVPDYFNVKWSKYLRQIKQIIMKLLNII